MEGRYQGRSDPGLCPTGVMECARLADQLSRAGIRSIFTSPLSRARQSAEIVADRLRISPIENDPRLAEIHFGGWEGNTQTQVRQRWPELLRLWKTNPDAVRFPGGETLEEARKRLLAFFKDIGTLGTPDGAPSLVMTHAGLIRLAILAAQSREVTGFRQLAVPPVSTWRFVLLTTHGETIPLLDLTDRSTGVPPATHHG